MESHNSISPSQAHYVLNKLISDKRVSAREVADYLSRMDGEIRDLEQRLAMLREARVTTAAPTLPVRPRRGRPAATPRVEAKPAAPVVRRRARKRARKAAAPATAERSSSQQLQGQYLSLIRQISKNNRPRFQQVALQQGREEAIKQMRAELKK